MTRAPRLSVVRLVIGILVLAGGSASSVSAAEEAAPQIDVRPLPLSIEVAFPNVQWPGWEPASETGVIDPLRPILLTNAGDETNRIFVPTQQGVIYVLRNDQAAKTAQVFLNIEPKVAYDDKTNEEGFLGLAFHPQYAQNGELYVYYTNHAEKHQNVVARYRVSKDDPNRADPESEEILLVFDKPFWNHDGGTICFGPDGYLYIAVGDGGLRDDPFGNGQKLSTLLGKILRIDVNSRFANAAYGIPADNPFVKERRARPEIYAYGLRNVWRMAFDPETKILWAGDVGQDTWEEIDLIVKGGNYGWNLREATHPFGKKGSPPRRDLIEPIWEYHHDVGKSITGGHVYRGRTIPELVGAYLYADYVAGKMWALWYDLEKKQVVANREIPLPSPIPVMSFGEDETRESYFATYSAEGQGIFRLGPTKATATDQAAN